MKTLPLSSDKEILLMTHIVLGHPSLEDSYSIAEEMVHAGVDIMELQIPFSEPTADGPVIVRANQNALDNGTKVRDCLKMAGKIAYTFDIPFLIGRSAATGVKAPKFNLARFRRDLGIIDLMEVLSFDGEFDLTGWSLGYYCEYFGLPTEPYGSGEDVAEWHKNGEWGEIKKHLEADVLMTRDLYQFCATAFGI